MCLPKITTEEETGWCNQGLETEVVNYDIKDFFILLPIRLLDAIENLIQPDKGSGLAIWIRLFTIREAHIESLMERVAEESSRDVEDGDLNVVLGSKADDKSN